MVNSILDTDLYKFSTSYAFFKEYPYAQGQMVFHDRKGEDWRKYPEFIETMFAELRKVSELRLTDEECDWCIKNIPYIPASYWNWLKSYHLNMDTLHVGLDDEGHFFCYQDLDALTKYNEYYYATTLSEIYVLETYSEVRNQLLYGSELNLDKVVAIIDKKIEYANNNKLGFAEFGARRRFSYDVQDRIIREIRNKCHVCAGTSNVHMAMKYHMTPTGTFPHEWVMFHAGVKGYQSANYEALEAWIRVYDGNLGTALVDTYTTDSFLHTLTRKQALLLSGFRQDSGDEILIGKAIIARLKEFGIDPKSKLIVFSNALDFEKYKDIHDYFMPEGGTPLIKVSAGIGTNLTSDPGIDNYKPANIVMKLGKCRINPKDSWKNVIKISDDLGKHMGDPLEFLIAKHQLNLGNDDLQDMYDAVNKYTKK